MPDEHARQSLNTVSFLIPQLCQSIGVEAPKVVLRFKDPDARDKFSILAAKAFEPLTGPFGDRPRSYRFALNGVSFSLEVGNADQ